MHQGVRMRLYYEWGQLGAEPKAWAFCELKRVFHVFVIGQGVLSDTPCARRGSDDIQRNFTLMLRFCQYYTIFYAADLWVGQYSAVFYSSVAGWSVLSSTRRIPLWLEVSYMGIAVLHMYTVDFAVLSFTWDTSRMPHESTIIRRYSTRMPGVWLFVTNSTRGILALFLRAQKKGADCVHEHRLNNS